MTGIALFIHPLSLSLSCSYVYGTTRDFAAGLKGSRSAIRPFRCYCDEVPDQFKTTIMSHCFGRLSAASATFSSLHHPVFTSRLFSHPKVVQCDA
jgi:hypothetical protein